MIMDHGARGWLYKTMQAEFWRVSGWCDMEDLIQDGHLIYTKIVRRYPNVSASQRMALFKASLKNYLHDLAEKRSRSVDLYSGNIALSSLSNEEAGFVTRAQPESCTLTVLLANAPKPIKAVLGLLASAEGRANLRGRSGENVNARLCRLTGLNSTETDLVGLFHTYFTPS